MECGRDTLHNMSEYCLTTIKLGFIIGSILGGKCSDRFGRKNTLIGATIVTIPSVMFGGYTSYYVGKQ